MDEDIAEILTELSPFLEKREKERDEVIADEIKSYGHRARRVNFLQDALSFFFEQDLEGILKYERIWKWLQATLKENILDILYDWDELLRNIGWKLEKAVHEKLDDLHNDLETLLVKQHREMWREKDLEGAITMLKSWKTRGIFVVLLDGEGHVIDEPYPVVDDPTAKVTVTTEADKVLGQRLMAKLDKPVDLYGTKVGALYLCKAPKNMDKIEICTIR